MLETTDGGKELVDALVSIARGVMPDVPLQEGSRPRKDQKVRPADQLKAIEMLLDCGFGRSPQQLDIAQSVADRPFAHLSDEMLSSLVENARQLEEASGVVINGDGRMFRSEVHEAISSSSSTHLNPSICLFQCRPRTSGTYSKYRCNGRITGQVISCCSSYSNSLSNLRSVAAGPAP